MRAQTAAVLVVAVLLAIAVALAVCVGLYSAEERRRGSGSGGGSGNPTPVAPKACAVDYSPYAPMVTCNAATGEPVVSCAALADDGASRALCAQRVTPQTLPTIDGAPEYACYDQRRRALTACDRAKASCVKGTCVSRTPPPTPPTPPPTPTPPPPSPEPTDPKSEPTKEFNGLWILAAAAGGAVLVGLIILGTVMRGRRRKAKLEEGMQRIIELKEKTEQHDHEQRIENLMTALGVQKPKKLGDEEIKEMAESGIEHDLRCATNTDEAKCISQRCRWNGSRNVCRWNSTESLSGWTPHQTFLLYKKLQQLEDKSKKDSLHSRAYKNIVEAWELLPSETEFKTGLLTTKPEFVDKLKHIVENSESHSKELLHMAILTKAKAAMGQTIEK